jgi:hypothetical protein
MTMYTPKLAAFIPILALFWAGSAPAQVPKGCIRTGSDLKELLETEYAFEQKAQESVRDAFLAYLAEDSLILQPKPTPGRAFYEAAKPNSDKLEWYPAIAAVAAGGDLGFSTGPWIYTTAGGTHLYGDFITVWKRDPSCRWRAQFDGGISHSMPQRAAPKLLPEQATAAMIATAAGNALPPKRAVALDQARHDFERTAQQDGLAAGLRTYARDGDFRFYVEGEAPQGAGPANQFLAGRAVGSWSEDAQGRSVDATLAYSAGRFANARSGQNAYLQIWQYDPKMANWGLRIFLITPIEAAK